jgi:hypothetical protein
MQLFEPFLAHGMTRMGVGKSLQEAIIDLQLFTGRFLKDKPRVMHDSFVEGLTLSDAWFCYWMST